MMKSRKRLHINRDNKKFLGVCAGIADYLEVETWIIRLLFVASVLMGAWFLIPLYFVFYFCVDSEAGGFKEGICKSPSLKHFRNVDYRKKLYRNTEEGKFLGVCAGIADYLEVNVTVIRLIVVILFFVAGPIPWVAYFAAWFILDKKPPARQFHGGQEQMNSDHGETAKDRFYSKRREFKNCTRKFSNLQSRLARIEAYVTSSQYKLHGEFKDIS